MQEKSSLILKWFEQHPNSFISGEQLSNMLNCSRTAVWKHINRLKNKGYQFEAVPKKGYRLIFTPDRIDLDRLKELLRTKRFGRRVHFYSSVETTMQTAKAHLVDGEGTLVLAEEQLSGKGRLGRKFHSPPGKGLWLSVILNPPVPLQQIPQITLLTSVALCRTIREFCGVDAKIKWPNDLLAGGKKISGILMESSAEDERLQSCIAGVGINVNMTPADFTEDIRNVATSLQMESGKKLNRTELLAAFLNEWEMQYMIYLEHGFAPIRTMWEALSDTLDKQVRLVTPAGSISGTAEKLDDSGALIIRTEEGSAETVYSGEIPLP